MHATSMLTISRPKAIPAAFIVIALFAIIVTSTAPSAKTSSLGVEGRSNATPWVAAAGQFVAVAWGASASGRADVFIAVSRDGGTTFGSPVRVNATPGEARLGGELPPRVAVIPKSGAGDPEIVVLWTARGESTAIRTSRSRDGGRTFQAPVTVSSSGAQGDRGWPALAVDHRGTAHAIWLDHRGLAADHSGAAAHAGHRRGSADAGVAMAQKSALYYSSGSSSGELELTKGVCYCCKTAFAAGANGVLYAAWRHVYPGNLRDIAFSVSRDGGTSFSAPVRVSEDEWAINGCPDDGPAIAVDARGTVHLVWPTIVGGSNPEGALFYASTRDGRTFTRRARIPTLGSLKPSHPQIVVNRSGNIAVAWDEDVNGRRVAAVRQLEIQRDRAIRFGNTVTLSPETAGMYPVLAATNEKFVAVWMTGGDQGRIQARAIR